MKLNSKNGKRERNVHFKSLLFPVQQDKINTYFPGPDIRQSQQNYKSTATNLCVKKK